MAYNPYSYVPQYGNIAQAGQYIAGAVAQMPQVIEAANQLKGQKAAAKNLYSLLQESAVGAYMDEGLTEAEARRKAHKYITPPSKAEMSDIRSYIQRLEVGSNLYKDDLLKMANRKQMKRTGAIQGAAQVARTGIEPTYAGEEIVRYEEPAATQQEFQRRFASQVGEVPGGPVTATETKEYASPIGAGLPEEAKAATPSQKIQQETLEQRTKEHEDRMKMRQAELRLRRTQVAVQQKNEKRAQEYKLPQMVDDYRLFYQNRSKLEQRIEALTAPGSPANNFQKPLDKDNPVIVEMKTEAERLKALEKALQKEMKTRARERGMTQFAAGLGEMTGEKGGEGQIGTGRSQADIEAEIKQNPILWRKYQAADDVIKKLMRDKVGRN